MIAVEGLVVRVGGFALTADLAVPAGALCAVIGPSGGGKSTLLAAIAGFVPLAAGRITVAGQDIAALPPAARPVTLLFQENNLFPHIDVAANVALGLRPTLSPTAAERAEVEAALEAVGLGGLGGRLPEALSGGQRQRAALARALLRDRPVLLLDEPFAGLGPGMRAEMLALVQRLGPARGKTVLMVTHAPEEAVAVAGLTAFCDDGRIGPAVETARLFADPPPALAAYLGRGFGG
jgi:thiamine transport system ATP-binding protein